MALVRATLQVTVFSFFGILFGFLNQLIVAYVFGASAARDEYFAALVIPTYVIALFASTAGVMFMSAYIEQQARSGAEEQAAFLGNMLMMSSMVLGLVSLICLFESRFVVHTFMPGFTGERLTTAADLLSILSMTIVFLGSTNILTSVLQANGDFLWPAAATTLANLIPIPFVLFFHQTIGIRSLAYGALAASVLTCAGLFVRSLWIVRIQFTWHLHDGVRRLCIVAAPLLFASVFNKATSVLERSFASTLEQGSISYLGYANQILNVLALLASGGIATTVFPAMTRSWEERNLEDVRKYFLIGIRVILLTTLPIAMMIIGAGPSFVSALLQRGAFGSEATVGVSSSLQAFMPAFIALSLGNIVAKGFYLTNRTRAFSVIVSVESVNYLLCGMIGVSMFSYRGLALALSMSTTVTIAVGMIFLYRYFGGFDLKTLALDIFIILLAAAAAGVAAAGTAHLLPPQEYGVWSAMSAGTAGSAVYLIVLSRSTRIKEVEQLKDKIFALLPFLKGRML